MKEGDLILLTKVFPFGQQEQYLLNELPFLIARFRKVIIVPYDEFSYNESENRLNTNAIEIFRINKAAANYKLSLFEKLKREVVIWPILLFELINGRETATHLRFIKRNLSQLRHSFTAAACLAVFLKEYCTKKKIFYNYWLHGGVIIANMCKAMLHENTSIISRGHAYDVYHKDWYTIFPNANYVYLGFESWKVYHCDKIYPISTHGYNHFVTLFPKFREKFSVSRLGVISNGVCNDQGLGTELLLVSCSNIDDNKRVHCIPEILSLIRKPIKWIHFGKGNAEQTERLEFEIQKYGLRDHAILKGFVANEEVRKFYETTKIDLFVNLSRIEGIPVSLMEAASCGIPMLATKTVGNPEIVNEQNGFLIDVEYDAAAVALRLNDYFNEPAEIENKRLAARKTFLEKYDASVNYPEFIKQILNCDHAA